MTLKRGENMHEISESQLDMLGYIINHLTVTGPVQGGMLNNAAGIINTVRNQKRGKEEAEEK